jgi:hypothetical protein
MEKMKDLQGMPVCCHVHIHPRLTGVMEAIQAAERLAVAKN